MGGTLEGGLSVFDLCHRENRAGPEGRKAHTHTHTDANAPGFRSNARAPTSPGLMGGGPAAMGGVTMVIIPG